MLLDNKSYCWKGGILQGTCASMKDLSNLLCQCQTHLCSFCCWLLFGRLDGWSLKKQHILFNYLNEFHLLNRSHSREEESKNLEQLWVNVWFTLSECLCCKHLWRSINQLTIMPMFVVVCLYWGIKKKFWDYKLWSLVQYINTCKHDIKLTTVCVLIGGLNI